MAKLAVGGLYVPEYGRPTWSDGNAYDGPPRGYYPVRADGSTDWDVRLRWIDDAPGNPEDGSGHFEVMPREAGYGYYHGAGGSTGGGALGVAAPEKVVPLAATVEGKAQTASVMERAATKIRYIIGGKR